MFAKLINLPSVYSEERSLRHIVLFELKKEVSLHLGMLNGKHLAQGWLPCWFVVSTPFDQILYFIFLYDPYLGWGLDLVGITSRSERATEQRGAK